MYEKAYLIGTYHHTDKENTKLGTHSFYAVPVPNGALTFNEVCEEACRNTSIEPSIMKAAVAEYMKTVQSNVLKGFCVPVGDQFLPCKRLLTIT